MAAATADIDAAARSAAGATGRAAAGERAATAPATTYAARWEEVAAATTNTGAEAGGVDAEQLGSESDERRWRQ